MVSLLKIDIFDGSIPPATGLKIMEVTLTSGVARRYFIKGLRPYLKAKSTHDEEFQELTATPDIVRHFIIYSLWL